MRRTTFTLAVLLGLTAPTRGDPLRLDEVLSEWPEKPRVAVEVMRGKYGEPAEVSPDAITWRDNGPWKRTVVYREEIAHEFPAAHTDFIEQTIEIKVPAAAVDELARFDGSLTVFRTGGELSSRCDSEKMNLAAINLAVDIARGRKSVAAARRELARTAAALMAGDGPAITHELLFDLPRSESADPDRAAAGR